MGKIFAAAIAVVAVLLSGGGVAHAAVGEPAAPPTSVLAQNGNQSHGDDTGLWGLVGLFGLAGLAGFIPRERHTVRGPSTTPGRGRNPQV